MYTVIFLMVALLVTLTAIFGERLSGKFMAWQETRRLYAAGADPQHINPPAQSDDFNETLLAPVWKFNTINGDGKIGHAPAFHNTTVLLHDGGLTITQNFDPDFEHEKPGRGKPAGQRYNNASLIGFQGYQPIPGQDVLFESKIQLSDNFYGSAGFVIQPQGTLLADGTFHGRFNNEVFSMFGIGFIGPESNMHGKNGTTLERVINWWPEDVEELNVDMHKLHTYLLRLHWVDAQTWLGTISVDGQQLSSMSMPPLGPLEVHIWGDNYSVATSALGITTIAHQNGPTKWIRFDSVSVWPENVSQ
jgi:hypothetical protein